MPRPDRGCCCDNSKSPDSSFCCNLDSYTDGRQTWPGCAASYTITWSNIQVFGAWDIGSSAPAKSGMNSAGRWRYPTCATSAGPFRVGCWGTDFGYSIKSNSVKVYKTSNTLYGDVYYPSNEVSGTYSAKCRGMTTAIQGDIITRACPLCECSSPPAEPCSGCFCGESKDVNFGNIYLRCIEGSSCHPTFGTAKYFRIGLGWRSRATLASTYNNVASDCTNACIGGSVQNAVSSGCFCHPGACPAGTCGDECGTDHTPSTGGNSRPTSIVDSTAFTMEFETALIGGDECPQGHTYSLTDWSSEFMEAFGTVTVS